MRGDRRWGEDGGDGGDGRRWGDMGVTWGKYGGGIWGVDGRVGKKDNKYKQNTRHIGVEN